MRLLVKPTPTNVVAQCGGEGQVATLEHSRHRPQTTQTRRGVPPVSKPTNRSDHTCPVWSVGCPCRRQPNVTCPVGEMGTRCGGVRWGGGGRGGAVATSGMSAPGTARRTGAGGELAPAGTWEAAWHAQWKAPCGPQTLMSQSERKPHVPTQSVVTAGTGGRWEGGNRGNASVRVRVGRQSVHSQVVGQRPGSTCSASRSAGSSGTAANRFTRTFEGQRPPRPVQSAASGAKEGTW